MNVLTHIELYFANDAADRLAEVTALESPFIEAVLNAGLALQLSAIVEQAENPTQRANIIEISEQEPYFESVKEAFATPNDATNLECSGELLIPTILGLKAPELLKQVSKRVERQVPSNTREVQKILNITLPLLLSILHKERVFDENSPKLIELKHDLKTRRALEQEDEARQAQREQVQKAQEQQPTQTTRVSQPLNAKSVASLLHREFLVENTKPLSFLLKTKQSDKVPHMIRSALFMILQDLITRSKSNNGIREVWYLSENFLNLSQNDGTLKKNNLNDSYTLTHIGEQGQEILDKVLLDTGAVVHHLQSNLADRPDQAKKFLSFLVPLVLSVLGNRVRFQDGGLIHFQDILGDLQDQLSVLLPLDEPNSAAPPKAKAFGRGIRAAPPSPTQSIGPTRGSVAHSYQESGIKTSSRGLIGQHVPPPPAATTPPAPVRPAATSAHAHLPPAPPSPPSNVQDKDKQLGRVARVSSSFTAPDLTNQKTVASPPGAQLDISSPVSPPAPTKKPKRSSNVDIFDQIDDPVQLGDFSYKNDTPNTAHPKTPPSESPKSTKIEPTQDVTKSEPLKVPTKSDKTEGDEGEKDTKDKGLTALVAGVVAAGTAGAALVGTQDAQQQKDSGQVGQEEQEPELDLGLPSEKVSSDKSDKAVSDIAAPVKSAPNTAVDVTVAKDTQEKAKQTTPAPAITPPSFDKFDVDKSEKTADSKADTSAVLFDKTDKADNLDKPSKRDKHDELDRPLDKHSAVSQTKSQTTSPDKNLQGKSKTTEDWDDVEASSTKNLDTDTTSDKVATAVKSGSKQDTEIKTGTKLKDTSIENFDMSPPNDKARVKDTSTGDTAWADLPPPRKRNWAPYIVTAAVIGGALAVSPFLMNRGNDAPIAGTTDAPANTNAANAAATAPVTDANTGADADNDAETVDNVDASETSPTETTTEATETAQAATPSTPTPEPVATPAPEPEPTPEVSEPAEAQIEAADVAATKPPPADPTPTEPAPATPPKPLPTPMPAASTADAEAAEQAEAQRQAAAQAEQRRKAQAEAQRQAAAQAEQRRKAQAEAQRQAAAQAEQRRKAQAAQQAAAQAQAQRQAAAQAEQRRKAQAAQQAAAQAQAQRQAALQRQQQAQAAAQAQAQRQAALQRQQQAQAAAQAEQRRKAQAAAQAQAQRQAALQRQQQAQAAAQAEQRRKAQAAAQAQAQRQAALQRQRNIEAERARERQRQEAARKAAAAAQAEQRRKAQAAQQQQATQTTSGSQGSQMPVQLPDLPTTSAPQTTPVPKIPAISTASVAPTAPATSTSAIPSTPPTSTAATTPSKKNERKPRRRAENSLNTNDGN